MAPTRWSEDAESTLKTRGQLFETYTSPGSELSFRHPLGWEVHFREDHAICKHGVPPQGFLTVYPIPNPEGGKGEGLLVAFIDEFIVPGVQSLNLLRMGPLPGKKGIIGAQFSLRLGGITHTGIALLATLSGLEVIVAYWAQSDIFEKSLATALLTATLGSVDVALDGPLAPSPTGNQY